MNYDLTRQAYGRVEYNIDQSLNYGDMPSTMLTEKFEETDLGNEEQSYDNYVRREICSFGPDRNLFEHERPRGAVNKSYGLIQLRSHGHRGTADVERPEIFLGFAGPEDRDPRGINVDPDMKELVRQEQARMRFIRFTPDHSDQVTGGMRSEAKVMADNQTLFKIKRDRLKVFSRQIDGRREGLRRVYAHKSDLAKQVLVQSYGDFIKDYAMNPQRRANIVTRNIIRDSAAWRSETSDQDYQVARYSQICRRNKSSTTHKRVLDAQAADDTKWSDADMTRSYKALGLLMSHMIRGKRTRTDTADGDIAMYASEQTQDRKNTPVARDIALILRAMTQDAEFDNSDVTMTVKTKHRSPVAVTARQVVYNHIAPAHHALNAEIIYKQVKPGADMRKIKDQVITDAAQVELTGTETIFGKTGCRDTVTGRRLDTDADDDRTESDQTVNYKTLIAEKKSRGTVTNGEEIKAEGDDTQIRRAPNKNYRIVRPDDHDTNMEFRDNTSKERLGGIHGSKYTMRQIDRDGKDSSLGE
jgi:hypothetical protein